MRNSSCQETALISLTLFLMFSVLGKQAESCPSRLPAKTTPRRHGEILHGSAPLQYVPRDRPDPGGNGNETTR